MSNQNVKIIGIGTGLTYSTLGPSHHTTEDIGLLRGLPNLTVFSPATKKEIVFEKGKPSVVREGKDIFIFTTGIILNEV